MAFALDAEAVEGCEEAPCEKGQFLEALAGTFGDLAVDESDVHSPFFASVRRWYQKSLSQRMSVVGLIWPSKRRMVHEKSSGR